MNKCERPQKGVQPLRSLHKVRTPPLHNGLLRNFALLLYIIKLILSICLRYLMIVFLTDFFKRRVRRVMVNHRAQAFIVFRRKIFERPYAARKWHIGKIYGTIPQTLTKI